MGIQLAGHLPQMLASMVEIDNLHRVRKVFGDKIPDPFGAIADDHLFFRTAPATFPRFSIDALAKFFRSFDGDGMAERLSLITSCLSRYTDAARRTRSFIRKATLSVIAGNPPADFSQAFGKNGMIVTVATNEKHE